MLFIPLMFINIDKVIRLMMIDGRCYVIMETTMCNEKIYRISYRAYNIIGTVMK